MSQLELQLVKADIDIINKGDKSCSKDNIIVNGEDSFGSMLVLQIIDP